MSIPSTKKYFLTATFESTKKRRNNNQKSNTKVLKVNTQDLIVDSLNKNKNISYPPLVN